MKKTTIIFLILLAIFSFSKLSLAQTVNNATSTKTGTSALVATLNIYNAKIEAQRDNTFDISFDLSNRVGMQSGVKYSVLLTKNGVVVDEKIYDEVVSIAENKTISKKVTYTPAAAISGGAYKLWIQSKNDRGLPFAMVDVGDIKLTASSSARIEIIPGTCFITVKNAKTSLKYALNQAIGILNTETLVLNCKINNTFSNSISLIPKFETYIRSVFGDRVEQMEIPTSTISAPKGISTFSVNVPKVGKAQSYETVFYLSDNDGTVKTNAINFLFSLKGVSGTIQNVVLDKDFYDKGDTANLQIFATFSSIPSSVDSLTRQVLNISIFDTDGSACSVDTTRELSGGENFVNISLPIVNTCNNPIARVSLVDLTNGNSAPFILDSRDFQSPVKEVIGSNLKRPFVVNVTLLVILLVLIVIIASIFNNKYKNKLTIFLLFFVVGFGLFGISEAKADTFSHTEPGVGVYTYTLNTNKNLYAVGEPVKVTGTATFVLWPNTSFEGRVISPYVTVAVDTVNNLSFTKLWQDPYDIHFIRTFGSGSVPYNRNFSVGMHYARSHNYPMVFSDPNASNGYGTITVPFEVGTPPPPTVNLSVNPDTITIGNSSTLTWSSTNATSCIAFVSPPTSDWTGSKSITSGSHTQSTGVLGTAGDRTYSLTCTGYGGTDTANATLSVISPTVTVFLSANPASGLEPLDTALTATRTGGTATGQVGYRFKCKQADAWSISQSSNAYSCNNLASGAHTASVELTQQGVVALANTSVNVCLVNQIVTDGVCVNRPLIVTPGYCPDGITLLTAPGGCSGVIIPTDPPVIINPGYCADGSTLISNGCPSDPSGVGRLWIGNNIYTVFKQVRTNQPVVLNWNTIPVSWACAPRIIASPVVNITGWDGIIVSSTTTTRLNGLKPGNYTLQIDCRVAASSTNSVDILVVPPGIGEI